MTKRQQALGAMRFAGYHDDAAAAMRLRVSARVSVEALNSAWTEGRLARERGIGCGCSECAESRP